MNNQFSLQKMQEDYLFAKEALVQFQSANKEELQKLATIPYLPYNLSILQEFVTFCEDNNINKTIRRID